MRSPRPLLAVLAAVLVGGPLAVLGANPPSADPVAEPDQVAVRAPGPPADRIPPERPDPTPAPPASGRQAPAAGAPAADLSRTGVVLDGDGALVVVPGTSPVAGSGRLRHYSVSVEGGIGIDPAGFADAVEATLGDGRSWGAGGRGSFQRVSGAAVDFQVVLASPATTDELCAPLITNGTLSCGIGEVAVINTLRWQRGADAYEGELDRYRQYVVNHEVGHTLGSGHARCPGEGRPAPVMMQQTLGVGACLASPWPFPEG